jgi:hypothetical protein
MGDQYEEWIAAMWGFLPLGYALTILIETPILLIGLSPRHSVKRRIWCGVWLTACTYPIVVLVLPLTIWEPFGRTTYLVVAETFAPLAECLLFRAFCSTRRDTSQSEEPATNDNRQKATFRDYLAITLANLCSFLTGEFLF